MSNTVHLVSTSHIGGSGGTPFTDCPPSGHLYCSTINQIVIRVGTYVLSLQIYYGWNKQEPAVHGTSIGGSLSHLKFDPAEYITGMEGLSNDTSVVQVTFVTNKRRLGPYGGTTGNAFKWGITTPSQACKMRLAGFSGSANIFLSGLQATFIEYRECPAQYEPACVELVAPISHSRFGRSLMSAPVALYVGEQRVKFHAHENILQELPFFGAALHGQFWAASETMVSMPDDDPAMVCALVEFLYTGNYTYMYDPRVASIPEGSAAPAPDIGEGLYHAGVYALASKYRAADLATRAMKNFQRVSDELDMLDCLRLWKAVYVDGLMLLPGNSEEVKRWRDGRGMAKWVEELFEEHAEEMDETVLECPRLAGDLLRIVTRA